ncbi:hypothetical protein SPRG_06472 [Saprolegnia parasitica CBS 223.65]|uniref:MalT-like TPR region domain-containing protein n=1 Tax=Saprolegnia parasitica (strain CBS 223.65) TaxID=695850 RepID=A0A067CQ15_SAPPC|nr:hypothetical protein SPRG_06472 [Saprolegnia parasitica CBS 223.65]KDO28616.1 hypothetical protein SPRG_06472 [Saprolegnia parasitica CBS 223.65]|eukprot:XP_012200679.1 hypothetical protein SPRG_06472 [Saprolegnia parasitica CBS 223.65]
MTLVRVAAAVASLLATTCYGKEFSASVSEIDVIPLMPYEPYMLPRMRWTDLNRALGSEASDKMLKSKEVDTLLGKIGVLKEDKAAFDKLSPMEVQSLYGDSEFEKEKDVLVALELYGEGDVASGIEILEQVQSHIERTRGKSHPLYANGLADLGLGYMLQRDFTTSHELLIAAMTLDEANQDKFGVYNLAASINLMVTSALRSGGGQFEPLSAAYETAFNALHKIEHPARYEIVVNMASMYRTYWRPLRAIQMFKIAKQLDAPPRYSGDVAHGLGLSYLMMGEAKQAKDLFSRRSRATRRTARTRRAATLMQLFSWPPPKSCLASTDALYGICKRCGNRLTSTPTHWRKRSS